MADLEDLDLIAPADSLYSGGVKINLMRARLDGLYTVLSDITAAEANQVENLGTTAITAAQWVYLSELDQSLTTTSTVTFGTINAFTLGGKLTAGAVEIEGSAFDINGGTIDAITHLSISGTAIIPDGEEAVLISCESETVAGNALWITLKSTVTSGDLTGIRSRVYGNAASAGANVRGGYFEAKMAAAGKKAAMLEGALFHADYSAGTATISGDVRGFTAHISQGAGLNAANLYGGLINIQTLGTETITTDDVGLMIRNEAVGGNGRTMDAGLKITDLNMGGGTDGFTYGIDLYGTGIATADIRLSGGLVLAASATLLTMPALALVDVTMSLGSDADGDIYYRSSNKLVRLAKGTAAQGLVMNGTATAPEWSTPAGGGIDNVVEDTTPQLGGELDCQAHTIGFTQQTATGDGTTTIDWKLGNKFYFTFDDSGEETFTFTQPTHECNILLVLKQDGVGSRTVVWPETVMWPAGTAPTLSTGANDVDIISFYWDGTNYHGSSLLDFSVPA